MDAVVGKCEIINQTWQHCAKVGATLRAQGETPIAIFDLDATLITDKDRPINVTMRLVEQLQRVGFLCCIVTARTSDGYRETKQLLDRLAKTYPAFKSMPLYCFPLETVPSSNVLKLSSSKQYKMIGCFKSATRWLLHDTRGPVVLAMGDQYWDIKLPSDRELRSDKDDAFLQFPAGTEAAFLNVKVSRATMRDWKNSQVPPRLILPSPRPHTTTPPPKHRSRSPRRA